MGKILATKIGLFQPAMGIQQRDFSVKEVVMGLSSKRLMIPTRNGESATRNRSFSIESRHRITINFFL
jgi:hypothetical protein